MSGWMILYPELWCTFVVQKDGTSRNFGSITVYRYYAWHTENESASAIEIKVFFLYHTWLFLAKLKLDLHLSWHTWHWLRCVIFSKFSWSNVTRPKKCPRNCSWNEFESYICTVIWEREWWKVGIHLHLFWVVFFFFFFSYAALLVLPSYIRNYDHKRRFHGYTFILYSPIYCVSNFLLLSVF